MQVGGFLQTCTSGVRFRSPNMKTRLFRLLANGRRQPLSPLTRSARTSADSQPSLPMWQAFIPRDKKGGTPVCNQTLAAKLDRREHERHRNAIRQARSRTDYSPPPPSIIGDDRAAAMRRHARLLAIEDGNARLLDKASALALALVSPSLSPSPSPKRNPKPNPGAVCRP